MTQSIIGKSGERHLLMGNEAIARGALEAGVTVVSGYPGTPSSEIVETLAQVAQPQNLYVEWSVNEKVAMEVAAAASFAGLRSLCVMKQNGVNVGSDFLLHLALTGIRGGGWYWFTAMIREPYPVPTRVSRVILRVCWSCPSWNREIFKS